MPCMMPKANDTVSTSPIERCQKPEAGSSLYARRSARPATMVPRIVVTGHRLIQSSRPLGSPFSMAMSANKAVPPSIAAKAIQATILRLAQVILDEHHTASLVTDTLTNATFCNTTEGGAHLPSFSISKDMETTCD